jgi:transmembrane sensor
MNDPDRIKALVHHGWDAGRESSVGQRVQRTLLRRRRVGQALAVAAVLAAATFTAGVLSRALAPAAPTLYLADGSTASAVADQTRLVALVDTPAAVTVAVEQGGALFDVVSDPSRAFHVKVGELTIDVVGTRFTVHRLDPHVRVAVERGRVRVGSRELVAGQSGLFPIAAAPVDWRELARGGDFDGAWRALSSGAAVRDDPGDLLLATDVARSTGHPADAVRNLDRLLTAFSADARAPLAAFTLGRVQLDDLGSPREAAESFARARALDENGPLAEDALGREVEAWSRAGDGERAREAARLYLSRFPNGARAAIVRRYSGL